MTRKLCILHGSPRPHGNTNQLVRRFAAEAERLGAECESYHLCGEIGGDHYDLRLSR
ncbi:MAG: NAD(P)H-dependent oxidoreductase [Oscillospiraceae bacterium]|nr:NAD(P)H-dependent oxidoreductase [Oscillospiraceae bacterium]